MNARIISAATIAAGIVTAAASAQCGPDLTMRGAKDGDALGKGMAGIGDVNDDGIDDFALGAPRVNHGAQGLIGYIQVYSGADLELLYQFERDAPSGLFGSHIAGIGDIDDDGAGDFLVSATQHEPAGGFIGPGRVHVFSGRDGKELYLYDGPSDELFFGTAISSLGDIDADGYEDFLIHSQHRGIGGSERFARNRIFSGATGELLDTINENKQPHTFLGRTVAPLGDIDGDGHDDFALGASGWDPPGAHEPQVRYGRAIVYSGADLDVIYEYQGTSSQASLGLVLAGVGDVSGDGCPDFALGDLTRAVRLYSGADGEPFGVLDPDVRETPVFLASPAGDFDRDGTPDIVLTYSYDATYGVFTGRSWIFSGRTRDVINVDTGRGAIDFHGIVAAAVGDINDDGFDDVLIHSSDRRSGLVGFYYGGKRRPPDIDGSGRVDAADLWDLLMAWGECRPKTECTADLNDDGVVDDCDLNLLLLAMGRQSDVRLTPR
jgi:hypothetical protein